MDNMFSDMGKFGINMDDNIDLFAEDKKTAKTDSNGNLAKKEATEEDYLLDKTTKCPLCDNEFKTKIIKSSKAKAIEPDKDLRPRYQGIDANKYGATVCPRCGYAALNKFFVPLPAVQFNLIREKISYNFDGSSFKGDKATYSYDEAIERHKLALVNSVVKKGKISERAYICLRLGWICRGYGESLDLEMEGYEEKLAECKAKEDEFLKNALDGFLKAIMTEDYPMCGMDEATVDYIVTNLAVRFKKFDIASKTLGRIFASKTASKRIKDRAYDLKVEIVEEIKKQKGV